MPVGSRTRSITQIPANFVLQSYLDATLLEQAILPQALGHPIVDSTRLYGQTPGVGVALHPCSNSPVAIKFKGGSADSAVVTLTPGEQMIVGDFKEFEWGLPYGWLGGGSVTLYVLHKPEARLDFAGGGPSSALFHRLCIPVVIPAEIPADPNPNWPGTFPWPFAFSSTPPLTAAPQPGAPVIAIQPDYVMFRLVTVAALAAPVTITLIWFDIDDVNENAAGVVVAGQSMSFDIVFPASLTTQSIAWIPRELAALVGEIGAASIIAVDVASVLGANLVELDALRYGRLG